MTSWHPVPGYEGRYEVSDGGDVRSLDRFVPHYTGRHIVRRGRLLTPCAGRGGYLQVTLSKGGHCKTHRVHNLVASAFLGPCPEGMVVRHLRRKDNGNGLDNLAYGTSLDNSADQIAHGTVLRGEVHPAAKLSERQVREIRRLRGSQTTLQLADQFGVSNQLISSIHRRKCWKHVA